MGVGGQATGHEAGRGDTRPVGFVTRGRRSPARGARRGRPRRACARSTCSRTGGRAEGSRGSTGSTWRPTGPRSPCCTERAWPCSPRSRATTGDGVFGAAGGDRPDRRLHQRAPGRALLLHEHLRARRRRARASVSSSTRRAAFATPPCGAAGRRRTVGPSAHRGARISAPPSWESRGFPACTRAGRSTGRSAPPRSSAARSPRACWTPTWWSERSTLYGWDYLAGLLICREAGAAEGEREGRDLVVREASSRRPVVAATRPLADRLLARRTTCEHDDVMTAAGAPARCGTQDLADPRAAARHGVLRARGGGGVRPPRHHGTGGLLRLEGGAHGRRDRRRGRLDVLQLQPRARARRRSPPPGRWRRRWRWWPPASRAVDAALPAAAGRRGPGVGRDVAGRPSWRATPPRRRPGGSEGRPLAAAHADVAWPTAPHLVLWHAQSILREYRGDGHVAQLVVHGLVRSSRPWSPMRRPVTCPAHVLRSTRGWPEEAWDGAVDALRGAGLARAG